MSFSNADTGSKDADPYKSKNIDEVSLKEKVEDLNEFIDACKFGMMTTRDGKTGALVSRCMAVAAKENGGTTLLFHTNTESGKTDELATDSHINISFLNSSGEWASISGLSTVETDRDLIKKYYTPTLKAWLGDLSDGVHDGGPNDPRIGIIKVDAKTATYAIVRKGLLARGAEVAQAAITGKTASVNKLREISEEEIQKWRTSLGMVQ
ncbi:f1ed632d-f51e-44d8-83b7-e96f782cd7a4 [Sclerotinia trifoliorum]|uniref:F1ed632d-f51e-44d8-83b7-e96f782cd7a4 n=1 Tax=Sclerotinia trifoliorum TaxID=28548 RepID=A0A8H2W416_9HELO|nr:f1ed632d-f51e-44d8-83b7-e96f782cd7a4 [Sclerotinia trifoliorum]